MAREPSPSDGNPRRPDGGAGACTRRACLVAGLGAIPGLDASASEPAVPVVPLAISMSVNAPFVMSLLQELAAAVPLAWDLHRVPFARVLKLARSGEALGFGISPSPDRLKEFRFTASLFTSTLWTISRASEPHDPAAIDDLRGLHVCMARDASYGAAMDAAAGRVFTPEFANGDLPTRLRMLAAGRCDAVAVTHFSTDVRPLLGRIAATGADPLKFMISRRPLQQQPVHIGVQRDSPLSRSLAAIDAARIARRQAIDRLIESSAAGSAADGP